jgi:hypothetical protein
MAGSWRSGNPAAAVRGAVPSDAKDRGRVMSDLRTRRLEQHLLWPEIGERLRHHESPESVHAGLRRGYPGKALPSARTMRRYVARQPETWFVPAKLAEKVARETLSRLADVTVLDAREERATLITQLKTRIARVLEVEARLGDSIPLMLPELRASMDLLGKLIRDLEAEAGRGRSQAPPADNRHVIESGSGLEKTPELALKAFQREMAERVKAMTTEEIIALCNGMEPPPAGTDVISVGVLSCEPATDTPRRPSREEVA